MTGADARPLRYLLLATHVPASGSGGGMIRYVVELAAALARRDDVELHVLAAAEATGVFTGLVGRERVHTIARMPVAARSLVERYGPVVPAGFDVVHGAKHLLPKRAPGAVRVLTVHDMLPFDRPHDFGPRKRTLIRGPYLGSLREADVAVCVSRATRARLLDYLPGAASRAGVVPLAASGHLRWQQPDPVPALAGRTFALVVGDASARKNLALAVQTWPDVLAEAPDAVLAVAGPGSWAGEHRGRRWDELVEAGSIVHLGHVSDARLAWSYQHTAAVLCPSLLEGFGLPTVEAAAFGAPVITSDDPALCEASGAAAVHVAAWSRTAWVTAVATAMRSGREERAGAALAPRSWDDVAAETLALVRGRAVPGGHRSIADLIGVSPHTAPLRVLHVVGPGAPWSTGVVEELAGRQRDHGWRVEVTASPSARSWPDHDVVVLHGLAAGALRRVIAGAVPTVVVAGGRRCPGPAGWVREVRLARHTNAMVVTPDVAAHWARRVPVPLASLGAVPGVDGEGRAADEFDAVVARARAWGQVDGAAAGQPVTL